MQAREVGRLPANAEPLDKLWERVSDAYDKVLHEAAKGNGAVVVVGDDAVLAAFVSKVCHC